MWLLVLQSAALPRFSENADAFYLLYKINNVEHISLFQYSNYMVAPSSGDLLCSTAPHLFLTTTFAFTVPIFQLYGSAIIWWHSLFYCTSFISHNHIRMHVSRRVMWGYEWWWMDNVVPCLTKVCFPLSGLSRGNGGSGSHVGGEATRLHAEWRPGGPREGELRVSLVSSSFHWFFSSYTPHSLRVGLCIVGVDKKLAFCPRKRIHVVTCRMNECLWSFVIATVWEWKWCGKWSRNRTNVKC